jgi:hypothetical protein
MTLELEQQKAKRIEDEWEFYQGMTEGEITVDLIERVSETEIKLQSLRDWVELKFKTLRPAAPNKGNYYSEDEIEALKEACQGLGVLPKGAITGVCDQLIKDGWNDTYDQTRTSSALRTKYLRLIGEK